MMKPGLNSTPTLWKPQRQRDMNDVSLMTVTNKVRQLLNKVTQKTLDQIVQELNTYDIYSSKEQLSEVFDLFVTKCLDEPEYCALYTQMMKSVFPPEASSREAHILLSKDMNEMLCDNLNQNAPVELEENPTKRDVLLADAQNICRRRITGFHVFIANLHPPKLVLERIFEHFISLCFSTIEKKNVDDEEQWILTGIQFLKILGRGSYYCMPRLDLEMALEKQKMKMISRRNFRLQFAIEDVLDLMKRDFEPRDSTIIV